MLDGLGLDKGDRIGIWSPNCTEWILVQYATAKLGAILVNVNPGVPGPRSYSTCCRMVGDCRILIAAPR